MKLTQQYYNADLHTSEHLNLMRELSKIRIVFLFVHTRTRIYQVHRKRYIYGGEKEKK